MNPTLKIDPEFEGKCPALTTEEFDQLLENILEEGAILMPLIIWDGVIIDGHNRYKIALKHPEIAFQIREKAFNNRYEALSWICKNQLGRRNLTPQQKKYLIGERYEAEKNLHGGDRKSENAKSSDKSCHMISDNKTRKKVAEESRISEGSVQNAYNYAKGVNAAEEALPGTKDEILTGKIKPSDAEVAAIAKVPPEQRKEKVEALRTPKKKDTAKSRDSPDLSPKFDPASIPAPSRTEVIRTNQSIDTIYAGLRDRSRHANADSMLGTIRGAVGDAIRTCEMVFKEFPQVRQEKAYLAKTVEILQELKNYIIEIEVELNEL